MGDPLSAREEDSSRAASELGGKEVVDAPRLDVVGFKVSALAFEDNVDLITHAALAGHGMWVMTLNLEMVARAATDPSYRILVESVDLAVADGVPIIWLSHLHWKRPAIKGRTCGVDLTERLLQKFPGRIGVLGGHAPRLALERLGVNPSNIVFIEDGPVRPGELASVIGAVNATRCQILFVALGVPKQDFVCRTLRAACPGLVCIGVGGSFEVLAGRVPRAPRWLRDCGLEWLFRLVNEPQRLWRRYLLLYPRALPAIARWTRTVTAGYRHRDRKSTSHAQHAGDRSSSAQTLTQRRSTPAPKSPVTH